MDQQPPGVVQQHFSLYETLEATFYAVRRNPNNILRYLFTPAYIGLLEERRQIPDLSRGPSRGAAIHHTGKETARLCIFK